MRDYDWTKISDTPEQCAISINNYEEISIVKYMSLREMYMECAKIIIKILEEHIYNLTNWKMDHDFFTALKKPNYKLSDNIFGFSNNGKEIIEISLENQFFGFNSKKDDTMDDKLKKSKVRITTV